MAGVLNAGPHSGARSALLGLAFSAVGLLTLLFALFHYEHTRRAIESGEYRASSRLILVFAAVVFLLGLASVIYLLTFTPR